MQRTVQVLSLEIRLHKWDSVSVWNSHLSWNCLRHALASQAANLTLTLTLIHTKICIKGIPLAQKLLGKTRDRHPLTLPLNICRGSKKARPRDLKQNPFNKQNKINEQMSSHDLNDRSTYLKIEKTIKCTQNRTHKIKQKTPSYHWEIHSD